MKPQLNRVRFCFLPSRALLAGRRAPGSLLSKLRQTKRSKMIVGGWLWRAGRYVRPERLRFVSALDRARRCGTRSFEPAGACWVGVRIVLVTSGSSDNSTGPYDYFRSCVSNSSKEVL